MSTHAHQQAGRGAYITVLVVALLGMWAALALAGCAPFATEAYKDLSIKDTAAGVAAEAVNPACLAEQRAAINKPGSTPAERTAAVADSEKRCSVAEKAVASAHDSVIYAKDRVKEIRAGLRTPADVLQWVVFAINSYNQLGPILAKWGISLPGVK